MRKNDKVDIMFTGIKSNKNPLVFDFSFHDSLCKRNEINRDKQSFGTKVLGGVKTTVPISTQFLKEYESDCFCSHNLTNNQVYYIRSLINQEYNYTFSIGNSIFTSVELGEEDRVYNTFDFVINYKRLKNNKDLYEITSLTCRKKSITYDSESCTVKSKKAPLNEGTELTFKFSVRFQKTFEEGQKIVSISKINTKLTLLLITNIIILVVVIIVARSDCGKASTNSLDDDVEESIWYYLRGDIFRQPKTIIQLCTFTGIGVQLLLSVIVVFLKSYKSFDEVVQSFISAFAWLGFVGGFATIYFFKQVGGVDWRAVCGSLFIVMPSLFIIIYAFKSFVFFFYDSAGSPTFSIIINLISLFMKHFISTMVGIVGGLKLTKEGKTFKVNLIPKQIIPQPYLLTPSVIKILGGTFMFANCYIVIDFIFKSKLNHVLFTGEPTTSLIFVALLCVLSAEVSLFFVYVQAKNENYSWWWTSFGCPAAIGLMFLVYSLVFIRYKTPVTFKLSSLCIYLSDVTFISTILSISCGSIGVITAFLFLKDLFSNFVI